MLGASSLASKYTVKNNKIQSHSVHRGRTHQLRDPISIIMSYIYLDTEHFYRLVYPATLFAVHVAGKKTRCRSAMFNIYRTWRWFSSRLYLYRHVLNFEANTDIGGTTRRMQTKIFQDESATDHCCSRGAGQRRSGPSSWAWAGPSGPGPGS